MREDWKYLPLGEICDFVGGSQPPKNEWIKTCLNGYVRMLQIRDFTKSRDSEIEYVKLSKQLRLCKEDDILLGRYGASVGKVLTGLEGAYNVAIIKSMPNSNYVSKSYIKRYFESSSFQSHLLRICNSRTAQAGFSKEDIYSFIVPVPPLSEQERIVSLLDEQFAKIDALKANAASQLQAAKDLFQAALKQLLTPQKGWEEKKLGEVSTIIGGSTPKTNDSSNWGGNNNWVTPAELNGEKYYGKTKRTISDKAAKGMQLLPIGTILLSSRAPIGKVAITTEPMYCNQGFKNIVCSNVLYNEYVYWYILFSVPQLEALGVGATFKELSKSRTEEFPISFPSLPEQERIAARLDTISEKVKALQANYDQTITLCNDLKQSLLKSIFA